MRQTIQQVEVLDQIREKFKKPLEKIPAEVLMKEFYELMGEREKKILKEKIRISHYCRLSWCPVCRICYPRRRAKGNDYEFECDCGRECRDITFVGMWGGGRIRK